MQSPDGILGFSVEKIMSEVKSKNKDIKTEDYNKIYSSVLSILDNFYQNKISMETARNEISKHVGNDFCDIPTEENFEKQNIKNIMKDILKKYSDESRQIKLKNRIIKYKIKKLKAREKRKRQKR